MIHGKTKIELYNPNTKIKNIIKSENTFQSNVLADYFRHYGEEGCNPFRAGNYDETDLWKEVVGGILLLKNPETVGNKFMTIGNIMVGNGSYGVSNSGNPNELGSYNLQESSASESEITQIYDFATNQANGNIACVCLTSRVGGYIGYGNKSGQSHASQLFTLASHQNTRGVVNFNVACAYGNYVYEPLGDFTEGKLRIKKTRRSLLTGSVFNGFSETLEFDLQTVGDAYSRSGLNLSYGTLKCFDIGNGIFRFIPAVSGGYTVAPNGYVYYYEFDAENETLTQKHFTNSSSSTILVTDMVTESMFTYFFGNYAFCQTGRPTWGQGQVMEVFNVNTSEHITTLDSRVISGAGDFRRWYITLLDNDWVMFILQSGSGLAYMYDIVNNTVYPTNSYASAGMIRNPSLGAGVLDRLGTNPEDTRTKGFLHNPLYLATINNLDSYVTKTANQTMKVTYTLTEE